MRWFAEGFGYVVASAAVILFMVAEFRLLTQVFG
jgi:hypothetical protein